MIGIICNTASIFIGGLLGNVFKKRISNFDSVFQMLGIAIMFMSVTSVISNTITVNGNLLEAKNIILIIFCLLIGNLLGEILKLDSKLSISETSDNWQDRKSAFMIATMMFCIGGLQIIGPISSVVEGDNSILFSKCLVDFPLAVSMGAMLGTGVAMSCISVGVTQAIIGLAALLAKDFFTAEVISQLSTMGYIVLFFVGFNMVFKGMVQVKTANMIPSILLIVVYNLVMNLVGV